MSANQMQGHYVGLDSLRGIAALTVVIGHAASFFVSAHPATAVTVPLKALMRYSHPAVILFFVLSGFLLMISVLRARTFDVSSFYIKRVFRIYPAFLVVGLLAVAAGTALAPQSAPALGTYWNNIRPDTDLLTLLPGATLLLWTGNLKPLPVAWSLVHEMRFSVVFPLLAVACRRYPVAFYGFTGLSLAAAFAFQLLVTRHHLFLGNSHAQSLMVTFFYLPAFLIGMVAALRATRLGSVRIERWHEAAFLVGAALVLLIDIDSLSACVATTLILLALADSWLYRALNRATLRFIGRISFSLYLVHFPVLFYAAWLARDAGPVRSACVLITGIATSLLLGWLVSRIVEYPMQSAGRRLSRRFDAKGSLRRTEAIPDRVGSPVP